MWCPVLVCTIYGLQSIKTREINICLLCLLLAGKRDEVQPFWNWVRLRFDFSNGIRDGELYALYYTFHLLMMYKVCICSQNYPADNLSVNYLNRKTNSNFSRVNTLPRRVSTALSVQSPSFWSVDFFLFLWTSYRMWLTQVSCIYAKLPEALKMPKI